MKKFATMILALVMMFAFTTTVFAAGETTSVTISNSAADRTYEGYKLLSLTVSHKTDVDCDDNHNDDCYNYSYTLNADDKYVDILQAEVFANNNWGTGEKPASAADVTEQQILDYLADQSGDNGAPYGSLRDVADRIYDAIVAAGLDADAENMTGNADAIAQGYWLIADVTDLGGEDAANSLVLVDTKGLDEITITPKTGLPTVEKKVKDINDSNDGEIDDNDWFDAADHDFNDVVPFKLTATLPSNVQYYDVYTLIFHDTMSTGLTLNDTSFQVLMYASKAAAEADVTLENGTAVDAANFDVKTGNELDDDCSFEIVLDDILAINGVTSETVFVVYYEATLNDTATIGGTGNPNEVYLEYSNNPYDEGTGETAPDKVVVFTYQLTINKVDADDNPLNGAGFTLSKKNAAGEYEPIGTELTGRTTFNWQGLDDGDYLLVESTVPAGYNKMEDVYFTITATHSETADEPALTALDGGNLGTGEVATGDINENITNFSGTVLPETGAAGTVALISAGALLVVCAAVFMITRKKMSIYED